ncbi:aspartic protease [Histoplasma capsulatum G186AR]|nr:aspartic protease [Histoplasma capsulatum G186AR]EEH02610.1 aspartic protease [Histoplasma capsulatum G186AR]
MRGVTALCTLGTALLCSLSTLSTPVSAIQLLARDARNVVGFDFQRRHVANPVERDRLRKRKGNVVEQLLNNEVTLYFCNITLGTPEQPLRMHLDTGSSDLWSNAPDSTLCTQNGDPCGAGGTYDRTASSTYEFVNSLFNISYVDGSSASGDYVTDTMRIGGVSLKDFQFGVGHTSSSSEGVLGIGYPTNEALMAKSGQKPYANLPFALVKQGLINWPAYSIWLNDLDASTGSILFGGVNTEKFHGKLQTLPIQQREGGIYVDLVVALTGLTLTTGGVTQRLAAGAVPILLDTGSSLSYLPDPLVDTIYTAIQAIYDQPSGAAFVPCRYRDASASFTFQFGSSRNASITVGMDELVLDLASITSSPDPNSKPPNIKPTFSNGEPACLFGISPAGDSTPILGDTFLRSAYVVYDLGNNQISLAQTNFNASADHILEIGDGAAAVPSATGSPPATSTAGAGPTARPLQVGRVGAWAGLVGFGAGAAVLGVV